MAQFVKLDNPLSPLKGKGGPAVNIKKNVMVLSEKAQLTPPQFSLLNRGLSFIPTRGSAAEIIPQTRYDLQNYHRTLKIWSYYEDQGESTKTPFTAKSTWTPPELSLPPYIRDLIKKDVDFFYNRFRVRETKSNLSPEENVALAELKENKQIIIKPADKGSMVVIMDRKQYIWEAKRQLNDTKYYKKLAKPMYTDTFNIVQKIFQKIYEKKLINAKQKNYLIGSSEPRARIFYLLPKIHKSPHTWSIPYKIPPGRPIVSDCSSETYRAAEFIDYYLNPLAKLHKSYIRDTYDFIEKIRNLHIPSDAILFTIDVDSLYTNIDTSQGMAAVKQAFQKHYVKKRPDKELLQLLEINLTRNDFIFDGEFYLQIKGTAMGKKFAPAYADLFMAAWETSALRACKKQPLHYYRYLDDIWGVWEHSQEDFDEFLNTMNNHNQHIKLKACTDPNKVDFLDTTTFKGIDFHNKHTLDIKVFFKETDTHALLHKSSFHPKHTFAGLIKSQLLRFHRICTQKEDFLTATKTLFAALKCRGYSKTFLKNCHKNFLQTKPALISTALPLVTTFSPATLPLIREIKKNFKETFDNHKPGVHMRIIAAYRKNKNLKDHLVRADLTPLCMLTNRGQQRSSQEYFRQIKWVENTQRDKVFRTEKIASPQTKNCVYLITCTVCFLMYVGETGNTVHIRFTAHKSNILRKAQMDRHIVKHFAQHGWPAVQATVLEANPHWSRDQRRRCERNWISLLGTEYPRGLNERLYFRP